MSKLAVLMFVVAACGSKSSTPSNTAPGPVAAACEKGGCSGTVCAEPGKQMMTTCEYKAEYACYQTAACERQTDGQCGWTQSPDLVACLANPPPMAGAPEHPPVPTPESPVGSVQPKPM
jgi:hypothetical protein